MRLSKSFPGRVIWVAFSLFINLFFLSGQLAAQARDELIERVELLNDSSTQMGIDEVLSKSFRPVESSITLGYTSAAHWLRLRINPDPADGEVILLIRPPLLDDVQLYVPKTTQGQGVTPAGDYIVQEVDWASSLRGYRLHPPVGGADYYVRIRSSGSVAANVTAKPRLLAQRTSLITDLVQIAYFSVMLVLFVWALRMRLITKERVFLCFAAMQGLWLLHNFIYFGYIKTLAPGIPHESLMLVFRSLVIAAAILSVYFHRTVLARFKPNPVFLRLFDVQIIVMLGAAVVYFIANRWVGLQINAYCIAASPFIFLLNVFSARTDASPGLYITRVIYSALSAALLLWVFSLLGFVQISVFSLYGFMIHGLTTGLLIFIILHLHGHRLILQAREATAQVAWMERQNMLEQEKNGALSQFIDMISHETRNALAVVNMTISNGTISDAQRSRMTRMISNLTDLIDRCNQAVRIDSKLQKVEKTDCDIVQILRNSLSGLCDAHRITLSGAVVAQLETDPVLVSIICKNLIENACKYSVAQSAITIHTDHGHGGLFVTFENTADPAGLPDATQVFSRYYRSSHAKSVTGSGLGLYIVQRLVVMLGGTITYQPEHQIVRFRLWLPN